MQIPNILLLWLLNRRLQGFRLKSIYCFLKMLLTYATKVYIAKSVFYFVFVFSKMFCVVDSIKCF